MNQKHTVRKGLHQIWLLAALGVMPFPAQAMQPDSTEVSYTLSLGDIVVKESAGAVVSDIDGNIASGYEILLRGISSIRGNNQPLILIDGVAVNSQLSGAANPWSLTYPQTNNATGSTEDPIYEKIVGNNYQMPVDLLAGLNPTSIKNVEILKNSSATAIYGARGANGVILITTHGAKAEKRNITFSTSAEMSSVLNRIDYLSPSNYLNYYKALTGKDYDTQGAEGVNWQDKLLGTAISTVNNLTLSGSNQKTQYSIALQYALRNGVIENSGQDQLSIDASVDRKINNIFRTGVSFTLAHSNLAMMQTANFIGAQSATTLLAAAPYTNVPFNSTAFANDYNDESAMWRVLPRAYVLANINRFISLKVDGGIDVVTQSRKRWAGSSTPIGNKLQGVASIANLDMLSYDLSATFNAKALVKKNHKLNFDAGFFYYGKNFSQNSIQGNKFYNEGLGADGITLAERSTKQFFAQVNSSNYGAMAMADYTLFGRFNVKGGARMDKQLSIGEVELYPFAQMSYDFARKELKGNNLISTLDLRAGWGRSGANNIMPYFMGSYYTIQPNVQDVPSESQLAYMTAYNSRNTQYDAGFDIGFLKDRVTIGATFYTGEVEDRVATYKGENKLDHTTMYMDKYGFEASIGAVLMQNKKFKWDVLASIGMDRVKVKNSKDFNGRNVGESITTFRNGHAPSSFYGYVTDGIVGEQHLPFVPPFEGQKLQEGDVKFVDINKDGKIDSADKTVIGSPLPDFVGRIYTSLKYKNFKASLLLDGSAGADILNLNLLQSGTNNILDKYYTEAWSKENPNNKAPRIGAVGMDQISDRLVENGSYLRISNITLSYDIPMESDVIKGLEVSLMARDLYTFTGYSGYFPGYNSFGGDWSVRGVDMGAYPQSASFLLGAKFKF